MTDFCTDIKFESDAIDEAEADLNTARELASQAMATILDERERILKERNGIGIRTILKVKVKNKSDLLKVSGFSKEQTSVNYSGQNNDGEFRVSINSFSEKDKIAFIDLLKKGVVVKSFTIEELNTLLENMNQGDWNFESLHGTNRLFCERTHLANIFDNDVDFIGDPNLYGNAEAIVQVPTLIMNLIDTLQKLETIECDLK